MQELIQMNTKYCISVLLWRPSFSGDNERMRENKLIKGRELRQTIEGRASEGKNSD